MQFCAFYGNSKASLIYVLTINFLKPFMPIGYFIWFVYAMMGHRKKLTLSVVLKLSDINHLKTSSSCMSFQKLRLWQDVLSWWSCDVSYNGCQGLPWISTIYCDVINSAMTHIHNTTVKGLEVSRSARSQLLFIKAETKNKKNGSWMSNHFPVLGVKLAHLSSFWKHLLKLTHLNDIGETWVHSDNGTWGTVDRGVF